MGYVGVIGTTIGFVQHIVHFMYIDDETSRSCQSTFSHHTISLSIKFANLWHNDGYVAILTIIQSACVTLVIDSRT
jgi:hypothetical protein